MDSFFFRLPKRVNSDIFNVKIKFCYSSIFFTSILGSMDTVKSLIEHGTDVNVKDNNGFTPLDIAIMFGNCLNEMKFYDMSRFLKFWFILGDTNIAKLLLDNGAAIDGRDRNGWTPLHQAALHGYYQLFLT